MAKPEAFEDHCWKDVVPAEDLQTYGIMDLAKGR